MEKTRKEKKKKTRKADSNEINEKVRNYFKKNEKE